MIMPKNNLEIAKERSYLVVKSNELIQKTRFQFSLQEQKALLYIISKLKPDQKDFEYMTFDLSDFCEVSGIQINGRSYADIKAAMDGLNKPFWMFIDEHREKQCHFITEAIINHSQGTIDFLLDNSLKPYLLELTRNYTEYELKYILTMRSKYSIRLYELLRSWANRGSCTYELDHLQQLLGSSYDRWQDIKRKVLEVATAEINECTDLNIEWTPKKSGRSITGVQFDIKRKSSKELMTTTTTLWKRFNKK